MNNAPETCDQRAADMWSFAMILWELATREVPFAELSPMEMGMKVSLSHTCSFFYFANLHNINKQFRLRHYFTIQLYIDNR